MSPKPEQNVSLPIACSLTPAELAAMRNGLLPGLLARARVGFFAPFLGAAAVARSLLGWSIPSSWLAGIALSTTSVAVVYAVMLELGLNRTK